MTAVLWAAAVFGFLGGIAGLAGVLNMRRLVRRLVGELDAANRKLGVELYAEHKGAVVVGPVSLGALVRIHRYGAYKIDGAAPFMLVPHVNGGTLRLYLREPSTPTGDPDIVQSPTAS